MFFFFLMIRRPPRSTLDRSSAASDVYKRQVFKNTLGILPQILDRLHQAREQAKKEKNTVAINAIKVLMNSFFGAVSYTHLRAHETVLDLVCRLLLEKKKNTRILSNIPINTIYTNY